MMTTAQEASRPVRRGVAAITIAPLVLLAGTALIRPSSSSEYRTLDGSGNNVAHPSWGTPGIHLLRGASGAHYGDGISVPAGADRPSPREISNVVFAQYESLPNRDGLSDYMWTWGQFLDHDMSLTEGAAEPFAVHVPIGDPFFDPTATGTAVIPFRRAIFDPVTGVTGPRQQLNEITSFIDASMVYGSDERRAAWLRSGVGGRLKVTPSTVGDLLPYNDGTQPNAGSPERPDLSSTLFVAGDIRSNEQPTLACLHTLFVREHNFQAGLIESAHRSMNDDEIYQRARRIVIAEIQAVTYQEFLPALLGEGVLSRDAPYNPATNPGIAAAFSTAAFRLGHTMLSSFVQRLDANGQSIDAGPLSLRDAFFQATPPMLSTSGIEPFLRGVAAQPMQELDEKIIDDVRNFLFGPPGGGGLDLISLNIQRGRDLGLPDYNTTRGDYGLAPLANFHELTTNLQLAADLESLYETIDHVDLFVGLLVEDDMPGAMIGRLLRAVLVDQFARLRDGDRFFYTRDLHGQELARIRATRLSDIIRRNTTIRNIQNDAFRVPGNARR